MVLGIFYGGEKDREREMKLVVLSVGSFTTFPGTLWMYSETSPVCRGQGKIGGTKKKKIHDWTRKKKKKDRKK